MSRAATSDLRQLGDDYLVAQEYAMNADQTPQQIAEGWQWMATQYAIGSASYWWCLRIAHLILDRALTPSPAGWASAG